MLLSCYIGIALSIVRSAWMRLSRLSGVLLTLLIIRCGSGGMEMCLHLRRRRVPMRHLLVHWVDLFRGLMRLVRMGLVGELVGGRVSVL